MFLRIGAVVSVIAGTVFAGLAAPASAGVCTKPYCGGTIDNNSSSYVWVANNWCWGGLSAMWYGDWLPCAAKQSTRAYRSHAHLAPGDTTAKHYYYYDTDAFRVEAGRMLVAWDEAGDHVFDNRYSDKPMWVRIHNGERLRVVRVVARAPNKFCLYRNAQGIPNVWHGDKVCFDAGNVNRLPTGWNDQASSLRNDTATTLCAYEDIDRKGDQLSVGAGHFFERLASDITPHGKTWNDRISSIGYCR